MPASGLMILTNGFEEIEAIAVIDILRRAGMEIFIAGLNANPVRSTRIVQLIPDCVLSDVQHDEFDIIILPGGEPGTTNLENTPLVKSMIQNQFQKGKWIGAICAAPRILDNLGLLAGKKVTSFPNTVLKNCIYKEEKVVVDHPFITSRGAGTAMAFAYKIVELLISPETASTLKSSMIYTDAA